MENVRKDRTIYRARFIPIDELYTEEERLELYKEFAAACDDNRMVSILGLQAVLVNMDFELEGISFYSSANKLILFFFLIKWIQ